MSLTYTYTAIKSGSNERIQGSLTAENERDARLILRERNLMPLKISTLSNDGSSETGKLFKTNQLMRHKVFIKIIERLSMVGLKEKLLFTQNLSLMLKAGIPITEVLMYMETYVENPKFKRLLTDIRKEILTGRGLSGALGKHPKVFDDTFIGIIRAGEASGELETVLDRLNTLLKSQQKLRKQVVSALIYPCVLSSLMVIVLTIMFVFIIPTFTSIYKEMGITLPLVTQIMINISDFVRNYWYVVIMGVITSIWGFKKYRNSPSGRERTDLALLKIPLANTLVRYVNICNFVATLQVSFSSGLPITDCLFLATRTITHTQIKQALEQVNYQVQSGQRFSTSIAQTGLMPDIAMIMFSTGEESGELEKMLEQSLIFIEAEVEKRVEIMMSLMEPLLLLVMGGIVLVLALSVYMPLFSMYENM